MSITALEDLKSMSPAQQPAQPVPAGALLEAYKKHVAELRGIEDRQSKLVGLILGILSAAGTLLINAHLQPSPRTGTASGSYPFPVSWIGHNAARIYVSLVAVVAVAIGRHAVNELHDLRKHVRDLLVRCEIALGFYETGAFLKGKPLYTTDEQEYPTKGAWMKQNYWIVLLVCAGFLLFLWVSH